MPLEVLRIGGRAAHRGDDDEPALASGGDLPRLGDGGGERGRRIRVRAIAEHHVEENDRRRRLPGRGHDALVPQAEVDHGMRPSNGELIVAQIDDGVLGPETGQDERSLLAQGPSTVEAVDQVLAFREAPGLGSGGRRGARGAGAFASRESYRVPCRLFEGGSDDEAGLSGDAGIAAEEVDDDRLARLARDVQDLAGHRGGGGLGDENDDARAGIVREPFDARPHHEAAHSIVEIVAAHADHLRKPFAEAIDETRYFLEPRARGADEADASAAHDIGEAQGHAVQDGRAAVRPHDEKILLHREPLQLDLVRHRNIVAEDEDVKSSLERLQRLRRGVGTGSRDDGEICLRQLGGRFGEAARRRLLSSGRGDGGLLVEEMRGLGERPLGRRLVPGGHRHHEVIGPRGGRGGVEEPGARQQLAIGGRGHHEGGPAHARKPLEEGGHPHQIDRIAIRVGANQTADGGCHSAPSGRDNRRAWPRGQGQCLHIKAVDDGRARR